MLCRDDVEIVTGVQGWSHTEEASVRSLHKHFFFSTERKIMCFSQYTKEKAFENFNTYL